LPSVISFTSHLGNPLTAEPDGTLVFNRTEVNDWERFSVEQHGGSYAFKSAHGRYLCSEPDGKFIADREVVGDWERWTIERREDGKVALRSVHGLYICAAGESVEHRTEALSGNTLTFPATRLGRTHATSTGFIVSLVGCLLKILLFIV